ncbi:MAG: hypothetical protein U0904_06565 [Candidatus Nanopelagicales bacterium]|nr:hypothetical protein [Candidatus Nanopelagicales bacterium]
MSRTAFTKPWTGSKPTDSAKGLRTAALIGWTTAMQPSGAVFALARSGIS